MTPDICIYHGNCADGFTAAWAVWKRFGDAVEFHPGVYGQVPPDVAGKNVVLVDFSYKRPVLEGMAKSAKSILVLDHHKTAEEDLADGGIFTGMADLIGTIDWVRFLKNIAQDAMENAGCRVYTVFDMARSGAGLAWDFFHPAKPRPDLIKYVEDRDLWKFGLYRSRDANAYIFAHDYTFENWDKLNRDFTSNFMSVVHAGGAIEKKHHKDVAELVAKLKRPMVIGGQRVPVASLPYTLTSDAGHLMCTQMMDGRSVPFAACYWDTPAGRVFSLRSIEGGCDVSNIAAGYGGGGHKHAAGFTMPLGWEGDTD